MKKKHPITTCMQQKVAVYSEHNIHIGTGWIYVTANGKPLSPTLKDTFGNCLEVGWYHLTAIGDPQLVVVARSVQ